jgi:hypothetical protein
VPAEAARLSRRLVRRDWWFIGAIVAATLVVALASIAFSERGGRADATRRCFSIERAAFMGAATTTYCDADAAAFCRAAPTGDREIAAKCAALGLRRPKPS